MVWAGGGGGNFHLGKSSCGNISEALLSQKVCECILCSMFLLVGLFFCFQFPHDSMVEEFKISFILCYQI